MKLDYLGESRIKLERVYPVRQNACRLSVATNAVNYFLGRACFDTETVFKLLSFERQGRGLLPLDLDRDTLQDEEINYFIDRFGLGVENRALVGSRALDLSFWSSLIAAGFLVVPDHQMLYIDPHSGVDKDFAYFPPDLIYRAITGEEFSYQTLLDLYTFYINYKGLVDEGHVDIVMDIVEKEGLTNVVLGNFDVGGNEHPISIPWNFFRFYLAFDWTRPAIKSIEDFPGEKDFLTMMETGNFYRGVENFFYGNIDVYFPRKKRDVFEQIVKLYPSVI